jgi:hypothetical protein
MKPTLPSSPKKEWKNQNPQPVSTIHPPQRPTSPNHETKKLEKRPQSSEAKVRQRRFLIEQKEIMAHLQAKKLHDEVKDYLNDK